tara:strand:+ start:351 stop:545 length:195 start_codon:yes stop_codon:yes gene_type:complete
VRDIDLDTKPFPYLPSLIVSRSLSRSRWREGDHKIERQIYIYKRDEEIRERYGEIKRLERDMER